MHNFFKIYLKNVSFRPVLWTLNQSDNNQQNYNCYKKFRFILSILKNQMYNVRKQAKLGSVWKLKGYSIIFVRLKTFLFEFTSRYSEIFYKVRSRLIRLALEKTISVFSVFKITVVFYTLSLDYMRSGFFILPWCRWKTVMIEGDSHCCCVSSWR